MSRAFSAWGTQLLRGNGGNPEVFTPIAEITKIQRNGGKADLVDVTNFDSPTYREKLVTLLDAGDVIFQGNFIPEDAGQQFIAADFDARALRNWKMIFPGGRGEFDFQAYVSEWPYVTLEVDKAVTFSGKLAITGNPSQPGAIAPGGGGGAPPPPPGPFAEMIVQKAAQNNLEFSDPDLIFSQAVEAGDFLIAAVRFRPDGGPTPPTLADSGGANDWIEVYRNDHKGIWYCANAAASAAGQLGIHFTDGGRPNYNADAYIIDIRGQDSYSVGINSGTTSPVNVTNGSRSLSMRTFVRADGDWAAALFLIGNAAGDTEAIAVALSDDGFEANGVTEPDGSTNVFPPAGWTRIVFPGGAPTSFSVVLQG